MCSKNRINVFGSISDIRQNAEWPRFFLVNRVEQERPNVSFLAQPAVFFVWIQFVVEAAGVCG